MNRFKELAKNTIIITIGRISTQLITFLLLPLYTAKLSTNEYGIVDFITTLVQLFIPIVSIMIDQGVFRYLLNCKTEEDCKKNISSAFVILSISNFAALVIFLIISLFYFSKYSIWVLLILIVTAYSNFFLQVSRGLKRTTDYAIGSFVCSSTTILLNVICIVALKMGAIGMIVSTFLGNVLCNIYLYFKLKMYKYISVYNFDKKIAKQQLKYSIPLIPNQLSLWIMNSSDRLIVSWFLGMSANGILAISHKFPSIFMTFYNIFQLAWHETGTIHYNDDDRDEFFSKMFDSVITVFTILCCGIIVVLPLVFDILINKKFFEAYYNIPIYMIAFLFNIVIGFLGVIYVATKKTTEIAKTTIIAAAINILVNILLVNKIGLYASSFSTLVGYLITMIYRIKDSKKYLNIKFNMKKLFVMTMILIIYVVIYYFNNKILSIIGFILFIPLILFLNKSLIKSTFKVLKERKNKIEK